MLSFGTGCVTSSLGLWMLPSRVVAEIIRPVGPRRPTSELKLQITSFGRYERLLGLTPYGTAILVSETRYSSNIGNIIQWSESSGRAVGKASLSRWINSYDLRLSLDGRLLIANNDRPSSFFPQVRTYRTTVLRSLDFKTAKIISPKSNEYSVGFLFLPDDGQHAIDKRMSVVGSGPEARFANNRFEWLNLKTGKVDKTLYYNPARGCDQIRSSPDHKYLACLFTDEHFDLIDAESERSGTVDILDARTGKIVWHITRTQQNPVGDPLFFISPTQFISSDTIFNIQTKTARHWNAVNASTRCLAVVPGHSAYALFLTKQGLQLRNWRRGRTLASWPTLTTQGRIFFAPDLKMFAYKRGPSIQFWRFDPNWLR